MVTITHYQYVPICDILQIKSSLLVNNKNEVFIREFWKGRGGLVSFVWEMTEYVTDGPYASLPPSHFLVLNPASAGIQKTCEPGWQFGKRLLLLCLTSCLISCLGDGTRRLVLFQVGVGWDTMVWCNREGAVIPLNMLFKSTLSPIWHPSQFLPYLTLSSCFLSRKLAIFPPSRLIICLKEKTFIESTNWNGWWSPWSSQVKSLMKRSSTVVSWLVLLCRCTAVCGAGGAGCDLQSSHLVNGH